MTERSRVLLLQTSQLSEEPVALKLVRLLPLLHLVPNRKPHVSSVLLRAKKVTLSKLFGCWLLAKVNDGLGVGIAQR